MGLFKTFFGYFDNIGKANTRGESEMEDLSNANLDPLDELELDIDDNDLLTRSKDVEDEWNSYLGDGLSTMRELCYNYWLGNQSTAKTLGDALGDEQPVDNVIYEALETYLPLVTKAIPEPIITTADNSEATNRLASDLRSALIHISSKYNLRMKMKKMERYRNLFLVGAMKMGWDATINEVSFEVIHPNELILESDASIDENGKYTGEIAGHIKREKASSMIIRFPKKEAEIKAKVNGKMGTRLRYVEFWTNEMVWWKMDDVILDKRKNPFYNYEEDTITKKEVDEFGNTKERQITARNYLPNPEMPFIFHSINSIEHPHDETNSVIQAIPLQDIVNKRTSQIDYNADNANGGIVISGDYFDKEQSNEVQRALRKNKVVFQKQGKPSEGVWRDTGRALPSEISNQLAYCTARIKDLFGVAGSTASAVKGETTVRGKIIAKESDSDRNSDPSSWIELAYKNIFSYMLQIMFVYYDVPHTIKILGENKTMELVTLSRTKLWETDFDVTVKEGSLIPKDPLTQRNEALDLYELGVMDPITLFNKLDYSNPVEMAKRLTQFKLDPVGYLQGDNIENSIANYLNSNPEGNVADAVVPNNGVKILPARSGGKPATETNPSGTGDNLLDQVPIKQ